MQASPHSGPAPAQTTLAASPAARRWPPALARLRFPYAAAALLVLLALWEAASRAGLIPPILLPSPSAIAGDLAAHFHLLIRQAGVTLLEMLTGLAASIAIAVPLAMLLGASHRLERMLYPLIVGSQTVPVVSVAPILLAWFGFGLKPKIIVVVLITFFPILTNTFAGMKAMAEQVSDLARSMGASRRQMFWHFQLPGALPNIFAGIRIAATLSVVGAVVAEFVGSDSGLGYEITVAGSNLDLAHQFAAVSLLTIMGLALSAGLGALERLCLPWHVSVRSTRAKGTR